MRHGRPPVVSAQLYEAGCAAAMDFIGRQKTLLRRRLARRAANPLAAEADFTALSASLPGAPRWAMRKPAALRPGDLIGVVAPGAAVEEAAVHAGARVLEQAGYRVRIGTSVLKRAGYLAGREAERLADLIEMFSDDEVRAIVAARGGYGSGRLLPLFDPAIAHKHPKIFVG